MQPQAYNQYVMLKERHTKNARVEKTDKGWILSLEGGDSSRYRDAQLDDYFHLPRKKFPRHSLSLSLRARASSASLPGTWGFGLWNDPFGLSLGFGGNPFRLPALPNAVWFFHASPQNHLSFGDDLPAQGFLAQTFRSPKFHPLLMGAGLAFPFSRRVSRKLLSKVIDEDGIRLMVNPVEWHSYRLDWRKNRASFWVDEVAVFESAVSPHPPLGIIIWIDNQFAAFTPQGNISAGALSNEECWVEIEDLTLDKKEAP